MVLKCKLSGPSTCYSGLIGVAGAISGQVSGVQVCVKVAGSDALSVTPTPTPPPNNTAALFNSTMLIGRAIVRAAITTATTATTATTTGHTRPCSTAVRTIASIGPDVLRKVVGNLPRHNQRGDPEGEDHPFVEEVCELAGADAAGGEWGDDDEEDGGHETQRPHYEQEYPQPHHCPTPLSRHGEPGMCSCKYIIIGSIDRWSSI